MDLPIDDKDLEVIVNALALGGDARLYHKLKEVKQVREMYPSLQENIKRAEKYDNLMSHLNVFDDKVPFIIRDNLWNYCINSTYRLGWEDTDVPEKYDLNIHSHWSSEELESTDILPHIKKCIDETDWFTNN